MVVIGVTGGFGTGKSTVAKLFAALGAAVLDADDLAHEAMAPGQPAWREIVAHFGRGMLRADRTIDRRRLATVVFQAPVARRRLEAMVHPRVLRRIRHALRQLRREGRVPAVVLDVPLLIEARVPRLVDTLIVVTAPAAIAARRLRQRGVTKVDIERRRAAQWDLSAKAALADYVVDNSDGLAQTRRQVEQVWNRLVEAKPKRHG